MPGVSIPAVTTKLEKMKADMRKGRRTGSPVSVLFTQHSFVQASLSMWCIRTRMKCAVDRLLRYPHLRRHLQDLALLVLNDQALCALEARGRCEECAVSRMSAPPSNPYAMQQRSKRKAILTHASHFQSSLPQFHLAHAQSS